MPTGPLEAQGRLCTKSAAAKIKRYCKRREGKHYSLQVLAELAGSSHYYYCCASLQKPIYEALPSLSQLYLRVRANQVIFIRQGKSSGIHILHTGLESSFTQHFNDIVVELLVHEVHSGVKDTV